MKNNNDRGFFDERFRLEKISRQNDPLVLLKELIPWYIFKDTLNEVFKKENKGTGGREPYDYLMMFKILILQRYYNLSDDQTEYQILDRLSFMRFLDLKLSDKVPDSKTIWLFRETLTNYGNIESMFNLFREQLTIHGYIGKEGKIVDASFVEVPRQRNTREENKQINEGEVPESWQKNKHKESQKDIDASWTKKNNVTFFGYKNHTKVDNKAKLIETYSVTSASLHDSQALGFLLEDNDNDQDFYGDSAYTGIEQEKIIDEIQMKNCVIEKGYKNKPLTDEQKARNKEKSKIRVRVEHVYGFIENSMNGSFIKSIGLERAEAIIGLMNLTYNLFRYIQLRKMNFGGIGMSTC
jgi:transposase, IS5 family